MSCWNECIVDEQTAASIYCHVFKGLQDLCFRLRCHNVVFVISTQHPPSSRHPQTPELLYCLLPFFFTCCPVVDITHNDRTLLPKPTTTSNTRLPVHSLSDRQEDPGDVSIGVDLFFVPRTWTRAGSLCVACGPALNS